ncbi:MAG: hypothetical protein NVS3B28_12160 [Candidatus Velthaea sp.]
MDQGRLYYTLLLAGGSHYIDQRAADRVESALRLDVDQFLINVKVCGSDEPDRLVAIRTDSVVSLLPHDFVALRDRASVRGRARSKRIVATGDVSRVEKAL